MDLKTTSKEIRKKIICMVAASKASHVGSSLSCADILAVLYSGILHISPSDSKNPHRDRFIMSKGHGCAALYATLAQMGFFPVDELAKFYVDGGIMPGHATRDCVPGVEASTGSLGHGLSLGVGIAFAATLDKAGYKTVVLLGDGECDEGSVWEAAMFAGHKKLDNLVVIIDYNELQAFGFTKNVIDLEPLSKKWTSFGWSAVEVDGHDLGALKATLSKLPFETGKPSVIIAHTVKGKGVSYMENRIEWHYKNPSPDQAKIALGELE